MELINKLKEIDWTTDRVTQVVTIILSAALLISLIPQNSPTNKFLRNIIKEIKRIEWLKTKDVLKYTIIVLLISVIAVAIMAPLDFALVELKKEYLLN